MGTEKESRAGADVPAADEVDGFLFGPGREAVLLTDAAARQRIADLEMRVAQLEALPRIWTGTEEEYEADNAAGKIRDGDIVITPEGDTQAQEAQEGGQA